MTKLQRV